MNKDHAKDLYQVFGYKHGEVQGRLLGPRIVTGYLNYLVDS